MQNEPRALLSPVHTKNNVEATFEFVEATFDFVDTNGNNVKRVYRKISSFRQSRNKLNMFDLFRLCRKNRSTCSIRQCCYDIVAGMDRALRLKKDGTAGRTDIRPIHYAYC